MHCHNLLSLFLLMYADSAYSQTHYYITPSPSVACPQDPCLTLAQFATINFSTNILSLSFLQGNHSLDRELSLSRADNFSMTKDTGGNGTVFVECGSRSGMFNISETQFTTIKGLHFIGCGGNRVSKVEQFIVEDTIFQGVEGRGTALVLNEVTEASIARSSFLSNTLGSKFEYHDNIFSDNISDQESWVPVLKYLYLDRNLPFATGGALYTAFSNVSIVSSKFTHNTAEIGGALFAHNSSFYITRSELSNNRANFGGVMVTSGSTVVIDDSNFSKNAAESHGGVMIAYKDSFSISGTTFTDNRVEYYNCGVMEIYSESSVNIINSIFTNNGAELHGGVMTTFGEILVNITRCVFKSNGGVIRSETSTLKASGSSFYIRSSIFINNKAHYGGVVDIQNYYIGKFIFIVTVINCTFVNNSAKGKGGVVRTFANGESSFEMIYTKFIENSATDDGAVIWASVGSFKIENCLFHHNKADDAGKIIFTIGCSIHLANSVFEYNLGSLYIFNSNLTVSDTKFYNCAEPSNKTATEDVQPFQEGGAITTFRSTLIFTGVSSLSYNQAKCGGAILATESKIIVHGETTYIANNRATYSSGGGISLQQSVLEIKGNCIVSSNHAVRGGGIHATSSTIAVYQSGTLQFINNRAINGSRLYLEVNPKLYILKLNSQLDELDYLLTFRDNHASSHGGAVYVADDTNFGACSPNNECFIQAFALHQERSYTLELVTTNIDFSTNTATKQGANIFGGLLDRCIPSPFAEVYLIINQRSHYTGIAYLENITINGITLDTISSLPIQICFCKGESEADCSYRPPTIKVRKGKPFTIPLVAVDQVNHSVDANITSSLSSHNGGFREGQQIQRVGRECTNLTFNVFSPHDSETMNLYADGPCGGSPLSVRHLKIQFTDCTCPVGFEPSNTVNATRCECDCDSKLSPHITNCNSTTESLMRVNTNSWITYINDTNLTGYIIHPNCPFDYCYPQIESISVNLNLPNGADTQCAYNHSGVLCGACQEHLSLSLGTSRCLPCHSHWPAVLVAILLAAIIAGILLVTVLLALNMTVAVGLINGFIFYANIVAANSAIFFPSSEPNFPTVFVAWLNLDIGIDVCFFDGLDAYTKTWLQLAFPAYIISLVIIVIIVSEYSPRFTRLIGKKDPIATLATLILLSYAKLLSVTITALSFAVLDYPDGSRKTVWLSDGNVKYFQGKHIALVLMALLIILIGVPYTILLFLWQWLIRAPKWKIFKWTRNTKLNAFVSVHHVPYSDQHRYWTGLLLLVRVIFYVSVSVTVSDSDKPQIALLITLILVGGLLFLKEITGIRVYKRWITDVLETGLYFNLLALAVTSLYDFKADKRKQTAIAYTSTSITFIFLIGVIIYHVFVLIYGERKPRSNINSEERDMYILASIEQSANAEITHSYVEFSTSPLQEQSEASADEVEVTRS